MAGFSLGEVDDCPPEQPLVAAWLLQDAVVVILILLLLWEPGSAGLDSKGNKDPS